MTAPTKNGAAPSPFTPIANYGFLSNCHRGALVAPDGTVDWLCVPRFDSPSAFGGLVDRGAGGFRFAPFGINVPSHRTPGHRSAGTPTTRSCEPPTARNLMERLVKAASPLGLFAEEYDVETGRHLGNFPQAFSHLALVEAAARLVVAEGLAEVAG
jgi:GH15 family glucan-1,4-alpha-glucosidase